MYLGVDGGGTKTAFALISQSGDIIAEHEEKTCYHITLGLEGAASILENGTLATLAKAGKSVNDIDYAFFGLPAYGEDSALLNELDNMPSRLLKRSQYLCGNDMISGWAAAFECQDGINIVSGTGSIAYGERNGLSARCGGWGELFSDEGSAYWIGRKGLTAFTKMSDGRITKGPLYQIVKSALNIEYDLDISALVLSEWSGNRSKIASLSELVSAAALAGDECSLEIFSEAGSELGLIVETLRKSLKYSNTETVNISYSGGVFNSGNLILAPFTKALEKGQSNYEVHTPKLSPVIGAAYYAREQLTKT